MNARDPFGLCGDGDKVLGNIRTFYDAIDQVVEDTWWLRWFVEGMAAFSLSGGPWGPLDFKYQAAQERGPFLYSLNGKNVPADYFGNYVAGYQAGYGGTEGSAGPRI